MLGDDVMNFATSSTDDDKAHLYIGGIPGKGAWDGLIDEVCLLPTTRLVGLAAPPRGY